MHHVADTELQPEHSLGFNITEAAHAKTSFIGSGSLKPAPGQDSAPVGTQVTMGALMNHGFKLHARGAPRYCSAFSM